MKLTIAVLPLLLLAPTARCAQDDVADVPSEDLRAGGNEKQRYFLIGPRKDVKTPRGGFGLAVILPGGPGTADFHPFVKRIWKNVLGDGWIAVQPVAVKFTPEQHWIWPTEKTRELVKDCEFTTEEFVEAVIAEVRRKRDIDPGRIFTLSWSSSGPAAYAISMRKDTPVTGSLVAMSVFRPEYLPDLEAAKGHAYFLYQSPDDRVTPFRFAEQAVKDLGKAGAKVELRKYDGGHGWHGDMFGDLKAGFEWLEKNKVKQP